MIFRLAFISSFLTIIAIIIVIITVLLYCHNDDTTILFLVFSLSYYVLPFFTIVTPTITTGTMLYLFI